MKHLLILTVSAISTGCLWQTVTYSEFLVAQEICKDKQGVSHVNELINAKTLVVCNKDPATSYSIDTYTDKIKKRSLEGHLKQLENK